VVVEVGSETVGLVVDSVAEVLRVPAGSLEDAPDLISKHGMRSSNSDFIKAIVKLDERLLVYLDVEKIIGSSVLPELPV